MPISIKAMQGYSIASMDDVKAQELATVCMERMAVAAAGDAVMQLSESDFQQWNADVQHAPSCADPAAPAP